MATKEQLLRLLRLQKEGVPEIARNFDIVEEKIDSINNDLFNTNKNFKEIIKTIESLPKVDSVHTIDNILKELSNKIDNIQLKKGDKGDNYILTKEDKKEIASSIKVPIVEKIIEKTEIVKEQPIIKNEIVKEITKVKEIDEKLFDKIFKDYFKTNTQDIERRLSILANKSTIGGGISKVFHDGSLDGDGTSDRPLSVGSGAYTDEKVKLNASDPTAGYLDDKITKYNYITSSALSDYVPYTGATTDVDLGTYNIKSTGTANFGSVYSNSPTPFSTGGFQHTGINTGGNYDFLGLFTEAGITPEQTQLGTNGNRRALVVEGAGAAYMVGRDITNDIEFIMGTSNAGVVFMGSMTNHALQFRINNSTKAEIKTTGVFSVNSSITASSNLHIGYQITSGNPRLYIYGYNTADLEVQNSQLFTSVVGDLILRATKGIKFSPNNSDSSQIFLTTSGQLALGTGLTSSPEKFYITSKDATTWERLVKLGTGSGIVGSGSYIEFPSSTVDGYGARIGGIRDGASGANAIVIQTGTGAQTTKFKVNDVGDTYLTNDIALSESTTVGGIKAKLSIVTGRDENTAVMINTRGGGYGSGIFAGTDDGSATADGDRLGYFAFAGAYDTTHDLKTSAGLFAYAGGDWTSTSTPSYMYLATTPAGSVTRVNAVKIGSDKNVEFYGTVKSAGYQSSDGTYGMTGTIDLTTATSIVVKNGLIVSAS